MLILGNQDSRFAFNLSMGKFELRMSGCTNSQINFHSFDFQNLRESAFFLRSFVDTIIAVST